jgi:2-phosphosulfolactate phosphatase
MEVTVRPPPDADEDVIDDDAVVVVDALRASATVIALLEAGARSVRPVVSVEDADVSNDALMAGEHHGERLSGFDFGNSPREVRAHADRVADNRVVIQTTNGTNCVRRFDHAADVLMGSLVNARALADTVVETIPNSRRVVVVPAWRRGDYAPEDRYTAEALMRSIERALGREPSPYSERFVEADATTVFRESDTGEFLADKGAETDVRFCAQRNEFDAVPFLYEEGFIDLTRPRGG